MPHLTWMQRDPANDFRLILKHMLSKDDKSYPNISQQYLSEEKKNRIAEFTGVSKCIGSPTNHWNPIAHRLKHLFTQI